MEESWHSDSGEGELDDTIDSAAHPLSLDNIMAEYLGRIEAGEKPEPEEYLRAYPRVADELRSFFRNHNWLTSEPLEAPSLVGRQVGPYRIEAEIARGGMGVIYRAQHESLKRSVALKLIGSGMLAGAEERRRFRAEAKAAAQLHHPGIIPIHDVGSWQGYEFFSMPLVDGHTLQQVVEQQTLDDLAAAAMVRDVARAVMFAHEHGIIHRDLKPDNVLIDADGKAMVADFGLAKWSRDGSVITRTGQVLGTPHYMSPEQASGVANLDERTDVYSLGAILFALVTGRPPHVGSSVAEVLRSVLHDEPPAPRQFRRELSTDLERICLQAMRFDAADRYPSAGAMADDLDRFLAGEAPVAASSGLMDRVARELRRDQYSAAFDSWGWTLTKLGSIILLAHVAIQLIWIADLESSLAHWLPRAVMFGLIAITIYRAHGRSLLPHGGVERPVWSIWLGYLATLGVMNLLLSLRGDRDAFFPIACALSGFGFVSMSGHVWGGSALIGIAFLATSIVMVALPDLAPLMFGLIWFIGLGVLGYHYRGKPSDESAS